jgi:DNA-binding transcriptional MocR family regulator
MDYHKIQLNKESQLPLYTQLAEQLRVAIQNGELPENSKLPPIRKLAEILGISPVTVTQAYEKLAAAGITGGQIGRGTYVLPLHPSLTITSTSQLLKESSISYTTSWSWADNLPNNINPPRSTQMQQDIQAAFTQANNPATIINLASGNPDPQLISVTRWRNAMLEAGKSLEAEVNTPSGVSSLQYGSALGDPALRTFLASYFQKFGFQPDPTTLLLTTGIQQSLDLIARALLEPGDSVFVEEYTYVVALDIFETRHPKWQPIPVDEFGMRLDILEEKLGTPQLRPRLLYTVPTGHSPSGSCMSLERRRHLVALAAKYNLLIIEDDIFGELYYDEENLLPALASFDTTGQVVYLKSFSKIIFPMVRLGCIVAAPPVLSRLVVAKQLFDRATSVPLARTVLKFINNPAFERELANCRLIYRQHRDALLIAMQAELAPLGCSWTIPQAGFNLQLFLPSPLDATQVCIEAAQRGLVVISGQLFATDFDHTKNDSLRLSFGDTSPAALIEAVQRLASAIKALQQGPKPSHSFVVNPLAVV